MSVQSAPFFWLVCDWEGCEAKSSTDEYAAWSDVEQGREQAEYGDWLLTDEGDFCPEHTHWDDELDKTAKGPEGDDG